MTQENSFSNMWRIHSLTLQSILVARPVTPNLTEVELQILQVLWDSGPSTVREVHRALEEFKETNYATTVKMLRVMHEKSLVKRKEDAKPIIYRAAITRERAQKRGLSDLITRLYNGSAAKLMMHALSDKRATPEEIAEIRQWLDEIEGGSP